jgi:endonuclease YncB( thermonuclease family)
LSTEYTDADRAAGESYESVREEKTTAAPEEKPVAPKKPAIEPLSVGKGPGGSPTPVWIVGQSGALHIVGTVPSGAGSGAGKGRSGYSGTDEEEDLIIGTFVDNEKQGDFPQVPAYVRALLTGLDAYRNSKHVLLSKETDPLKIEELQNQVQLSTKATLRRILNLAEIKRATQYTFDEKLDFNDNLKEASKSLAGQINMNAAAGHKPDPEQVTAALTLEKLAQTSRFQTQSLTQRPPNTYAGGTGGAVRERGGASYDSSLVALQLARNAFDQASGQIVGGSMVGARKYLIDQTRQAITGIFGMPQMESVVDPITGAAKDVSKIIDTSMLAAGGDIDVAAIEEASNTFNSQFTDFTGNTGASMDELAADLANLGQVLVALSRIVDESRNKLKGLIESEQKRLESLKADPAATASDINSAEQRILDLRKQEQALNGYTDSLATTTKTVGMAANVQKQSGGVLDTGSARSIESYDQQMKAIISRPGLLAGFSRAADRRRTTAAFARDFAGEEGAKILMGAQGLVAYTNSGARVDIAKANTEQLTNLQTRLNKAGSAVSMEQLIRLQQTAAQLQSVKNQQPFGDKVFYLAAKMRDYSTIFDTAVQYTLGAPRILAGAIQQAANPALTAARTMVTAQGLSRSPEVYGAALGAASTQQSMFGGSLTSNLGQITSFIPLTNAYGVDINQVVNVARKLAAFDPAQGMEGASIAIKEFLSGNVASLSRRFEINRSALSKINQGDASQMLDSLDEVLGQMGVTDRLIDEQANSLGAKYDKMLGRLESAEIAISSFAVEAITPALDWLAGPDSFLASKAKEMSLTTARDERMKFAGDAILTDKKTGFGSEDLNIFAEDYFQKADAIIADANDEIIKQAMLYQSTTGKIATVSPYRRLANMSPEQRAAFRYSAVQNMEKGMNQAQAQLQALRDIGGDYATFQELAPQRQLVGSTPVMSQEQRDAYARRSREISSQNVEFVEATIVGNVDADTIKVDMPGFEDQSVRIAGIDAPEKIFGEGKTAKDLAAEILKVNDKVFLPKKSAGFAYDESGNRIVSEVYMKNMQNYGLIALEKGLATTGFMDKSGFSAEQQKIYSAFEAAAAEQGIGPVNERAYKLGAGANFAISQEAKDKYFRDTYLMGIDFDLGKMLGLTAGAGMAGAFSVPLLGGMGLKGIAAATAAQVAWPAAIAASTVAIGGGAYYAWAKSKDYEDTSAEKLKELTLIEDEFKREAQFRLQGQAIIQMAERSPNVREPIYLSPETKIKYSEAKSSAGYKQYADAPGFGLPIEYKSDAEDILNTLGEQDKEKFLTEFTERKKVADEALEERYNQASEIEKQFYDAIITSPFDGQKVTYFEYRSTYDAMQQMAANGNQGMADLLEGIGQEKLLAPIEGMLALKEYEDTLKIAEKYGLTYMTMPEFSGPSYIQASQAAQAKPVRKAFNMDDFASASTAKRMSMLMDIQEQVFNPQNFKIQAKEYTNQMLEESMQIRQRRFNTVVEANAMNAMAGLGFTNFGAIQSGRVPLESATIMGNDFISAETRAKGMLRLQEIGAGVEQDSDAAEELDTAQANAVAKLQELAKAYQEQASATLANTVMYNSSFANLAAAISMSSAGFNNMMDIMGQGDPFFAQKYFRQMSGVDFLSVMQGGIFSPFTSTGILGTTSINPMSNALMPSTQVGVNGTPIQMVAGRNGALQFENSYTQGPRGAIAFANDMQSNSALAQMLSPQQYFQTILAPAIAGQTELTRRGIQQGNQMRDLQRQHNYSLEDITRNGMRQLESIHRNYTRNMYQLTLNNELVKRMNNANMHQSILAADISEEDRNDLLAFVAQNQQKIRHSEQGDVTSFLASTQLEGADVDALRAAEAAYQAVPFTDPTKKEEAQLARMAAAETVKTRLDTMIAEEKDPQKRADLLKQRALLDKDPARAAAAEQLLLPEVQRRLGDAVNRRAFGYAKEDRDFELSGLGLRRAGLLKARDDAYKADKTDPVAYSLGIQNAERNLLEFDRANNIATRNFGNLARGIDAASKTAPMFEDAFTTGMNNALTNTSTTLSGILTEYDEFGIGIRNQIEDEALNFERQRLALITSFSDALVEIAAQVPITLQNATQAYMEFAAADALAQAELQSGNVSGARKIYEEASTNYAKRMFPDDPDKQKNFNSLIMKGAPQGPNKSANGLTVGGLSDFAIQTPYGIAMKTYQVGDSGTAAKPNSVNPSGVAPITIIVPQKGTGAGAFADDGTKGRKIYYLNPE